MPAALLADVSVTITEVKKAPMDALGAGADHDEIVAIMHHSEPVYYAMTARRYAAMRNRMEELEDALLARMAKEAMNEPRVRVNIDDL
ncbi:type II toxin-antitoxin system Phd/YefM family antitoxin [Pseudoroseomonas globiformis]|uniref:Type II toxin-antitoxin system Phd/YefM family antitoxin n=1 Tax=Teichococcus globiformis TaxID=2307229 RepID=A0ABV7FVE4_9PROT